MKFNTNMAPGRGTCRHSLTLSMFPVPPGTTRLSLYCGDCPFDYRDANCLFRPPNSNYSRFKNPETAREKRKRLEQEYRSQGLNAKGEEMARTCWNCANIGYTGSCYICVHGLLERTLTLTQAYRAWDARECEDYEKRLTDVELV